MKQRPAQITCARCGRAMLAALEGNGPGNDAMEVCGLCWAELTRDQAVKLARVEALCDAADSDRPNALASHVVYTSALRAVLTSSVS